MKSFKIISSITATAIQLVSILSANAQTDNGLPATGSRAFSNATTIPLDTAVHTGVLSNGFTYYIRHNETPKNRVYLYLVVKAGSVLEDDDQQGLAHFMEHMNFNGTIHFPKNELVDYLQRSGVRFGADLNAYTSFDETVFELPIPADDSSIVQNGFRIIRDWAQNALLDSVEIEKERGVVLEESRLGKGAQERMQRLYWPLLFEGSQYRNRVPIGVDSILKSFSPSAIRRFHHDWYRPDLEAIVVVGDIDISKAEAEIKKIFSDMINPSPEKERTKYTVPLTGADHFMTVTDKEMPSTEVQVLIKHKGEELVTENDYRANMTEQLFNQLLGERFAERMQEPDPPFVDAGGSIGGFLGGLNIFSFGVAVKEKKIREGFTGAWSVIERVKRFGFTEPELERAKKNYLSGMEASFREKDKTNSASYVGEYQRLFLRREASPGIAWEYHFVKDHIDSISLADVNDLIHTYLKETDRIVMLLAPDAGKNELPDSATVSSWLDEVAKEPLTAYEEKTTTGQLIATMPAAGTIISKKEIPQLGVTEIVLSNGAKVLLKPTAFKNDEILFSGFSEGGTSGVSDNDYQSAANAAPIINSFGAGDFSSLQLNKVLAGKRVNVSTYIGERSQGISGFSAPQDLETALQLLYLRMTAPRKDSALFATIISNAKESLKNRNSDPNSVFRDTVNLVLGNYHFRRTPPSVEKAEQIRLDKAFQFYKSCFADASGFSFVVVGNFTVDSIEPLLEKYIGALPSLHANKKAKDLHIEIPAGRITKKVYKGSEDKATVRLVYSGNYSFSASNNMVLSALKEILEIRITQHLREDESEVYSPMAQVSFSKYPRNRYSFTVVFGCAPRNVDHLISLVNKDINELKEQGPTPGEIEKFKAEYKRNREQQIQNNGYLLNYLQTQLEDKETISELLQQVQECEAVTAAAVKKAAGKYMCNGNEIHLILLPENPKQAEP